MCAKHKVIEKTLDLIINNFQFFTFVRKKYKNRV